MLGSHADTGAGPTYSVSGRSPVVGGGALRTRESRESLPVEVEGRTPMPILAKLQELLEQEKVPYSVHSHPEAYTARAIAALEHVKGRMLRQPRQVRRPRQGRPRQACDRH